MRWKDMDTHYAAIMQVTLEVECPKCHKEQTMVLESEKFYTDEETGWFVCEKSLMCFSADVKYKMFEDGMMEYFKYDSEGVGADLL